MPTEHLSPFSVCVTTATVLGQPPMPLLVEMFDDISAKPVLCMYVYSELVSQRQSQNNNNKMYKSLLYYPYS